MNRLCLIILLAIGTDAFGQSVSRIAKSPTDLVPVGYVVADKIEGDLNGDNRADYVLIIKGTSKNTFAKDESRGELDRNRRGIIIALGSENGYELALENRACFSSENEDGGVYFAPELDVTISKANLRVHYAHGRYGYWTYSFRFQNSDFELIGYDSSEDRGPVVERTVSINFQTQKVRVRQNVNAEGESAEEKFKENWNSFALEKPISLRNIADFDNFDVEGMVGSRK